MTQQARTARPLAAWIQQKDAHAAAVKGDVDAVALAKEAAERLAARLVPEDAKPVEVVAPATPLPVSIAPVTEPVVPQSLSLWRAILGATLTILRKVWP